MDINIIISKLTEIRKEVEELHPLLRSIFNKIEDIEHTDYTHGNNEYGADFILSKSNPLIGTTDYIGVIAKAVKISQSDSTVERQINECMKIPRVISGKKDIYLNEIWVITSSTISQNAKTYYSKAYQSSKINFIDNQILARWISKYLPDFIKEISLEISQYLLKTKENLKNIERNSSFSIANLEGFEIEQDLIKIDIMTYNKDNIVSTQNNKTKISDIINKKNICLIEGTIGSGKSNLLRKTALKYCDTEVFIKEKVIPIYITLKELEKNYEENLENLVEDIKQKNKIKSNEIKFLILLDSLDEIRNDLEDRINTITKLTKVASNNTSIKLIMASRDIDNIKFKTIKSKNLIGLNRYEMEPLSSKKIIHLIEKACININIRNRVAEDIKNPISLSFCPALQS